MTLYIYKVVPAPSKGRKAPGVKGAEARFAHGLETAINEMAAEGWEYIRADILPSEERQGLTSTQTVYRTVLVFRRPSTVEVSSAAPVETSRAAEETLEDRSDDEDSTAARTLPGFRRRTPPPVAGEGGPRLGLVASGPRLSDGATPAAGETPHEGDGLEETQGAQSDHMQSLPEDAGDDRDDTIERREDEETQPPRS